jgi:excisionase family DNA binding protein
VSIRLLRSQAPVAVEAVGVDVPHGTIVGDVVVEVGVAEVDLGSVEEGVTVPKRRPIVGDRLLTVAEVAGTMRVSNMTVYRLIKAGQLAAIRVGKNYRIRESDVDRYLSERFVRVEGAE